MIDMTKPLIAEIISASTIFGALVGSVVSSPPDPGTVLVGAGSGAVVSVATIAYLKAKVENIDRAMAEKASNDSVNSLAKSVAEIHDDVREIRKHLMK